MIWFANGIFDGILSSQKIGRFEYNMQRIILESGHVLICGYLTSITEIFFLRQNFAILLASY